MSLAHKDDYFETPDWLFNSIVNKTGLEFDLDMCASEENTKCLNYINEETDALKFSGDNKVIFCNPPRSKNGKFVNKVYETWEGHNTILKNIQKIRLYFVTHLEVKMESLSTKFMKNGKRIIFLL